MMGHARLSGPRATALRLAGRLSRGPRADGDVREVVVIKPDNLGDVLLASPALHLLASRLPAARITLAVGPWSEAMARRLPGVDRVELVPFPGLGRGRQPSPWARWLLLARLARRWRGRFDAGLVLRDDFYWGAMLLAAARVPVRAGAATPACAPFLTRAVQPTRRPTAVQHLSVAALVAGGAAGPDTWTPERRLRFVRGDDASAAGDLCRRAGFGADEAYALLHPGAGAAIKLWTAESWAAVVQGLHAASGLRTLVVAGPGEQQLIPPIVRRCQGVASAAPVAPDLDTLAALLRRARLVLGPDSGPLHLAAALDTPSVRLYGPTDPAVWGPWADPRRHRWVGSSLLCAPCDRLSWDDLDLPWHPCVSRLDPDAVLAAAMAALARTPAPLPGGEGLARAAP